jgi:hypothetical protein
LNIYNIAYQFTFLLTFLVFAENKILTLLVKIEKPFKKVLKSIVLMNKKTVTITFILFLTLKILIYYGTKKSEPVRNNLLIYKSINSFNFRSSIAKNVRLQSRKKHLILATTLTVISKTKSRKFEVQ